LIRRLYVPSVLEDEIRESGHNALPVVAHHSKFHTGLVSVAQH
jgi:hypothetical protein